MKDCIMIVDDDHAMRLTIASILEDEGYQTVRAGNGREALTEMEQVRPALIVLDIAMPEMDGYAFADELERRGMRPAIPVLVVTAGGHAPQKAARVGAEGYLAKPFSLMALVEQVNRLLGTDAA